MRGGINTKYSHTLAETVRVLRSIPQFSHLRGHFFILLAQLDEPTRANGTTQPWLNGLEIEDYMSDYPFGGPFLNGKRVRYYSFREVVRRLCNLRLGRCPVCGAPLKTLRFEGRRYPLYIRNEYCWDCDSRLSRFRSRNGIAPRTEEEANATEELWLSHVVATRPKWAMRHKRARP